MTLMSVMSVSAQNGNGPLPNDSISQEAMVQLLFADFQTDSLALIGPIIPAGPGGPKSPARPHYVGLNGHTLYTYGQFDGYTLYIINDANAVVYTTEVWADEQTVALPEWLTGTLTLVFADDDGGCYYGEIEL